MTRAPMNTKTLHDSGASAQPARATGALFFDLFGVGPRISWKGMPISASAISTTSAEARASSPAS